MNTWVRISPYASSEFAGEQAVVVAEKKGGYRNLQVSDGRRLWFAPGEILVSRLGLMRFSLPNPLPKRRGKR